MKKLNRAIWVIALSVLLLLLTIGHTKAQGGGYNPCDSSDAVVYTARGTGMFYNVLSCSPRYVELPRPDVTLNSMGCPTNTLVWNTVAAYGATFPGWATCLANPVQQSPSSGFTYYSQAYARGGGGETGSNYVGIFFPLTQGLPSTTGGGLNPVVVCHRVIGAIDKAIPSSSYTAMIGASDGPSTWALRIDKVSTTSTTSVEGCDCMTIGCDADKQEAATWVVSPVETPSFLPVIGGAGAYLHNGQPARISTFYAVYPDCGDASTPFPPTCIGLHAQKYVNAPSGAWSGQSFFYANTPFGGLGNGGSVDILLRGIIPGYYRNGLLVPPSNYALPASPSLPPETQSTRLWPLPSSVSEANNLWMHAFHSSEWAAGGGMEIQIRPGEQIQNYVDNHPLSLRGFRGNPTHGWGAMIPLDIRAIGERMYDTQDDGLSVNYNGSWANPESVTLTTGINYRFRVMLQSGAISNSGQSGSLDVWAVTNQEGNQYTYTRVATWNVPATSSPVNRTYYFTYTIPSGVTFLGQPNRLFVRLIYRVAAPSKNYPTTSGFQPYRASYDCSSAFYSCSQGQVTFGAIAEPLAFQDRLITTGEVEDYSIPVAPALVVDGHTYRIPRGDYHLPPQSPLGGTAITLTAPSGVYHTTTNSTGYYSFTVPIFSGGYITITAPLSVNEYAFYESGPGEQDTANRPSYSVSISRNRIVYHFPGSAYGYYRYNDFGYGTTIVSGQYIEIVSGKNIPGQSVRLRAVAGEQEIGNWGTTTTDSGFIFNITGWDSGFTALERRLELTFVQTATVQGGPLVYVNHWPGIPAGNVITSPVPGTVLTISPGTIITSWVTNNVFYVALTPVIERKYPVVPVNPDSLVSVIPSPLRQVVTTSVNYLDPELGWQPLQEGVQQVYLSQSIALPSLPRRYYLSPECNDNNSTCQAVYCIYDQLGKCSDWQPLGGQYVYFASAYIGQGNSPGISPLSRRLPYRLFAATNATYEVYAVWHVRFPGADGITRTVYGLRTNTVTWRVVGLAAPLEEE